MEAGSRPSASRYLPMASSSKKTGLELGPQQNLSLLPGEWKTKGPPKKAKNQKGELILGKKRS